jgi:hypothetical protein
MAWITLVATPVLILLQAQVTFLPYHREWIVWLQRVAVLIDLALIWYFWIHLRSDDEPIKGVRRKAWMYGGAATLCVVIFSTYLATFPGEWIKTHLPEPSLLQALLFEGDVDTVGGRPQSVFSNRLVLTDQSFVVDPEKLDKITVSHSFRARDLRSAVLNHADLRKADFTGAQLQDASLDGAKLQGASLDRAQLQGASLISAQLQDATLREEAQLQGARLDQAQLQGASLFLAQLQGARLDGAQLQGAWLNGTQLQGASQPSFDHAMQYAKSVRLFERLSLRDHISCVSAMGRGRSATGDAAGNEAAAHRNRPVAHRGRTIACKGRGGAKRKGIPLPGYREPRPVAT